MQRKLMVEPLLPLAWARVRPKGTSGASTQTGGKPVEREATGEVTRINVCVTTHVLGTGLAVTRALPHNMPQ
eukprot:7537792-Alexandrium_andersonii.AAC.1